jgi:hypothetical protein
VGNLVSHPREQRLAVLGNEVLSTILGPKTEKITGDWTKLNNGELRNLYFSLNIIRIIKSRRMG